IANATIPGSARKAKRARRNITTLLSATRVQYVLGHELGNEGVDLRTVGHGDEVVAALKSFEPRPGDLFVCKLCVREWYVRVSRTMNDERGTLDLGEWPAR